MTSKEWGGLGIEEDLYMCLERKYSNAIYNYGQTFPLRHQVIQLGGLEICATALLKIPLQKVVFPPTNMTCITLHYALLSLCK